MYDKKHDKRSAKSLTTKFVDNQEYFHSGLFKGFYYNKEEGKYNDGYY
jgi:hypothetical protein